MTVRRFGREKTTPATTHVIKCGVKGDKFPTRLMGFLVCWNTLDPKSKKQIDFGAMEALGFSRADVEKGIELGVKAEPGKYLPHTLNFKLPANVHRDSRGGWDLNSIYHETLFCMFEIDGGGKQIVRDLPFCYTEDGVTAKRLDADGLSRKTIRCVPMGSTDSPEGWCEHSCNGSCKPQVKIFPDVYLETADGNAYLSPSLKWGATFEFKTTADTFGVAVQKVLTSVSDILDGRIAHIRGVLTVGKKNALKNGKTVVAPVYTFTLNQQDIHERYQELHANHLVAASAPVALLTDDYEDAEHADEIELDDDQPAALEPSKWQEDVRLADIVTALMLLAQSIQQAHEGMPNEEAVKAATFIEVEADGKTKPVSVKSFDYFDDAGNNERKGRYLRALHKHHTTNKTEGYDLQEVAK